jgi:hypothetical protein
MIEATLPLLYASRPARVSDRTAMTGARYGHFQVTGDLH